MDLFRRVFWADINKIKLTSSAIPFETQTLSRNLAFDTLDVVQDTLEPYLPILSSRYAIPNTDSSLLSLRLTTLTTTSILGIKWAHILGDASSAHRFLSHLSSIYAGNHEIDNEPSFFPHISLPVYPPLPDTVSRFDIAQLQSWDPKEAFKIYGEAARDSEKITLCLTKRQIAKLREEFHARSDQDAISAWWISLMQRCGARLKRLIYTVNVGCHRYHAVDIAFSVP